MLGAGVGMGDGSRDGVVVGAIVGTMLGGMVGMGDGPDPSYLDPRNLMFLEAFYSR